VVPLRPAGPSFAARWLAAGMGLFALISLVSLGIAVNGQQRLHSLERELVKRQQGSQDDAAEARMLAHQAQDASREAAAKVALLDARVSEATLQRSQIEDLIQSLSRSRDENVVADVESSLRIAQQQTLITGSAEPLVAALKQADDRLARYNQPRLERVRRAIARDLDRVKATSVVDIQSLTVKLDEVVRQVDELPLVTEPHKLPPPVVAPRAVHRPVAAPRGASGAAPVAAAAPATPRWTQWVADRWDELATPLWQEARTLIRVNRIDNPEAALVAPEQAFFLRENVKLRLLNARLGLLSRQFDTAQADLRDAQSAIERYFDRSSKRVALVTEQLRQATAQARQVTIPRPDETLAALTAAAAGR
jgi:uroporphyrin-3 C-methyltransferase